MNWTCSFLDKFALLSNSDAHSPEKLGRNANIFNTALSFPAIVKALKNLSSNEFVGTIDMFPQEGKYHYDGHRKCGVCFNPAQTLEHKNNCPVCGKELTIGVMNRIAHLSDRDDLTCRKNRKPFFYIIPLKEIISEAEKAGPSSKKVHNLYLNLISALGTELDILLNIPIKKIEAIHVAVAKGIENMRNHCVTKEEGYDGQFGKISVLKKTLSSFEKKSSLKQKSLLSFDLKKFHQLKNKLNK